jgi:outer membrane protein OmpA-like peptidoglycan-associated protein
LRSEPGIVVIEEKRHWLGYAVTGLHDPLAADPKLLLAESKVPARRVTERWEPYQSLDSKFDGMRGLEAEKMLLERHVLHFDMNSARLPMSQFDVLDAVEEDVNTLRAIAGANGVQVRIGIYGHTDRTGKEDHNMQLSQERANAISNALVQHGIPASILSVSGVADSNPGHAALETYPQELDRRVTFRVVLLNPSQVKVPR